VPATVDVPPPIDRSTKPKRVSPPLVTETEVSDVPNVLAGVFDCPSSSGAAKARRERRKRVRNAQKKESAESSTETASSEDEAPRVKVVRGEPYVLVGKRGKKVTIPKSRADTIETPAFAPQTIEVKLYAKGAGQAVVRQTCSHLSSFIRRRMTVTSQQQAEMKALLTTLRIPNDLVGEQQVVKSFSESFASRSISEFAAEQGRHHRDARLRTSDNRG